MSDGTFFGLGHPMLDVNIEVSSEVLQRYNLQVNGVILAENVPNYDQISREILERGSEQFKSSAGGSTQNTLKTISWFLGQPNVTVCMGCVGKDREGEKLEQYMKNCVYQKSSNASTATCLILVTDQARSMITNLGAANDFTIDYLNEPENWSYVERAKIFSITGYFIRTCSEAVFQLADHTRATKKILAFNLSAEYVCRNFGKEIEKLLPSVDFLFCNEQEARCLAQERMKLSSNDSIKHIARELRKLLTKTSETCLIITRGADSVILASQHDVKAFTVKPSTHIVDTIGCGDAFVGGFLASYSLNKSIDDCLNAACYCAYECLAQMECQFRTLSSFDEKERFCTLADID